MTPRILTATLLALTAALYAATAATNDVVLPRETVDGKNAPKRINLTDYGASLLESDSASAARTALGLVIGTDVPSFSDYEEGVGIDPLAWSDELEDVLQRKNTHLDDLADGLLAGSTVGPGIPDASLSANVPLKNASNIFSVTSGSVPITMTLRDNATSGIPSARFAVDLAGNPAGRLEFLTSSGIGYNVAVSLYHRRAGVMTQALGIQPEGRLNYYGPVTVNGAVTVTADQSVNGSTTLGDAAGDAVTINSSNPLAPNLTTMSTPTTLANRQAGDARWASRESVAQRLPVDYLVSDGTAGSRVQWQPGAIGAMAGLPAVFRWEGVVPTSNPTAADGIEFGSSKLRQLRRGREWVRIQQDYDVRRAHNPRNGSTASTNFRDLTYTGFRAAYSGQWVRLAVVFPVGNSTTNPLIYVNGVDITASFTLSTSGTPPNWMDASLVSTYHLAGYNSPANLPFVAYIPIIGAWTPAEAIEWTGGGRAPVWCDNPGSAVATYTSDFSAGVDGWAQNLNDLTLCSPVMSMGLAGSMTSSASPQLEQISGPHPRPIKPRKFTRPTP